MQEPGGYVWARLQNNLGKLIVLLQMKSRESQIGSFARSLSGAFSNHKFFPRTHPA
jgi:hypothetical protein